MKTCIRCGAQHPATSEFFPSSNRLKSGFCGHCRVCDRKGKAACKASRRDDLLKQRRDSYAYDGGLHHRTLEASRSARDPIRRCAENLKHGVRERSQSKGLSVDQELLTTSYWYRMLLSQRVCQCCEIPFRFSPSEKGRLGPADNSASVDRIDPRGGYVIGNVALLCWRCNNIKRNYSSHDLRIVADWIDAVAGKSEETQKDVVTKG